MNVNSFVNKNSCTSPYIVISLDLLHDRLGHVNYPSLKSMMDLGLISRIDFKPNSCEIYVRFKFLRKPFKSVE